MTFRKLFHVKPIVDITVYIFVNTGFSYWLPTCQKTRNS